MTAPKTVLVGDRVRYESAAGTIRGEVHDIVYGENALGDVIPWIIVRYIKNNRECVSKLPGNCLEMYKFVVTFRDIEIQIARGEKEVA